MDRPSVDKALKRLRELRRAAADDQGTNKKLDFRTYIYCVADILIELLESEPHQ